MDTIVPLILESWDSCAEYTFSLNLQGWQTAYRVLRALQATNYPPLAVQSYCGYKIKELYLLNETYLLLNFKNIKTLYTRVSCATHKTYILVIFQSMFTELIHFKGNNILLRIIESQFGTYLSVSSKRITNTNWKDYKKLVKRNTFVV